MALGWGVFLMSEVPLYPFSGHGVIFNSKEVEGLFPLITQPPTYEAVGQLRQDEPASG